MEAIRRDPGKGLRLFYETYGKLIQVTALVACRSSDKVGEVIDDVFVKVWTYAKSGGRAENPGGWFYRVTANTARQATRARYVVQEDLIQEKNDIHRFEPHGAFKFELDVREPAECKREHGG